MSRRTPVGSAADQNYDVLIVGSGFGGSVSALRLAEKGYRVGVLETGRRWDPEEVPATNWHLRRWLWAPALKLFGPQRITVLNDTTIASAVAVGGGSSIYACTLYRPLDGFYTDPQWSAVADWRAELEPHFDQAERMLGAAVNPRMTAADEVLLEVARDLGVESTFHPTTVGVFFGEPGKSVPDPYFGGVGPARSGCVFCSECMIGCRHNAKNTLLTNYLHLAERAGVEIHPLTTVVDVQPRSQGGYRVVTRRSDRWAGRTTVLTANEVVFSAASLGTQRLLHDLKRRASLPGLSKMLGHRCITNNEAILGVLTKDRPDVAEGVTITSSLHPEPDTHMEVIHYGKGSNAMNLMTTTMVDGDNRRLLRWLAQGLRHPVQLLRSLSVRRASERGFELVVMKDSQSSLVTYLKRGVFGWRMTTRQGEGPPNPTWLPTGHDVVRRVAAKLHGLPLGTFGDLVGRPTTAHFLGGCPIGLSPETGVVDPYHRVFGHPGLHVIDGSTLTANLGVNPSLTITAMAERAVSMWPNNGGVDTRPALGAAYTIVAPVQPIAPAVPAGAAGELRLVPVSPGTATISTRGSND
jgi:cholesterol oxidase